MRMAHVFLYCDTPLRIPGEVLGSHHLHMRDERGCPVIPAGHLSRAFGATVSEDGRLLALCVRALRGAFAWVCPHAAATDVARLAGVEIPSPEEGMLAASDAVELGEGAVIEGTIWPIRVDGAVARLAEWLSENALPRGETFEYWREAFSTRMMVASDADFAALLETATISEGRTALDERGVSTALRREEWVPAESLFSTRIENGGVPERVRLGQGATVGRGWMCAVVLESE